MKITLAVMLLASDPLLAQTNTLTTNEGKVYSSVKVIRAEPDGLCIEYVPEPGAAGMAKVQFAVLPPEIQKQYGYDPIKAAEFSALQTQSNRAVGEFLNAADAEAKHAELVRKKRWLEVDRYLAESSYWARQEELERKKVQAAQKAADAAMIEATRPANVTWYWWETR